jgi:hypothetical protein
MVMVSDVRPLLLPSFSISWTISKPSMTSPKTVCFPSNQGQGTVVMKNYNTETDGEKSIRLLNHYTPLHYDFT